MSLADEVNLLRSRPSLSPNEAVFVCTSFRSPAWLRHIQFSCKLILIMCCINMGGGGHLKFITYKNRGYTNTCGYVGQYINNTDCSCGQWLSHVKMSSGEVSLSSFHLPPSTSHHSLSLLWLSPSLYPPHRHFCVCLSPCIPIEDFLGTVARW